MASYWAAGLPWAEGAEGTKLPARLPALQSQTLQNRHNPLPSHHHIHSPPESQNRLRQIVRWGLLALAARLALAFATVAAWGRKMGSAHFSTVNELQCRRVNSLDEELLLHGPGHAFQDLGAEVGLATALGCWAWPRRPRLTLGQWIMK